MNTKLPSEMRALLSRIAELEVTELARALIMWHDISGGRPTGKKLFDHLKAGHYAVPDWLFAMVEDNDVVPSKPTRAYLIHLALLDRIVSPHTTITSEAG